MTISAMSPIARSLVEQLKAVEAGMEAVVAAIRRERGLQSATALRERAWWDGYEQGMRDAVRAAISVVEEEDKAAVTEREKAG